MSPRWLLLLIIGCGLQSAANGQTGVSAGNLCAMLNNCNGHGRCNTATKTCTCFEGFGAPTDITNYAAPDCSLRKHALLTAL